MRRWLPYLTLVLLTAATVAVWQFVFHGVDPALIFKPPPKRVAPPDVSARVSIEAKQLPFGKLLAELERQSGVSVALDASALAMPAAIATTPIDLTVDDVPLGQAVQLAVARLGDPEIQLRRHDGKLLVVEANAWRDNQKVEPRLYPLGALLAQMPAVSPEALTKAVYAICNIEPYALQPQHDCRLLPGGLLLTTTPDKHQRIEVFFAALLRLQPTPGESRQAYVDLSEFAPSDELLARLDALVDVDLDKVPGNRLAKELERQCQLPVRSQIVAGWWAKEETFTYRARQRPVREILAGLGQNLEFSFHGDLVWMQLPGEDALETGEHVLLYPVGDLIAALSHPGAPLARAEFARWFESKYGEATPVLVGDVFVVCRHFPHDASDLAAEMRALREAAFGKPGPGTDWRSHVALARRLEQPLSIVCDQPRLSERLAQLAEESGVPIEFDPALDGTVFAPPPLDPFGGGSIAPLPKKQPLPIWTFANESLNDKLDQLLGPWGFHTQRTEQGLTVFQGPSHDREPNWQHRYHRLYSLLSAGLDVVEARRLLDAICSHSGDQEAEQPGAIYRVATAKLDCHFAVAEMIETLAEHARHPKDLKPWRIESLRQNRIMVFPIRDLREQLTSDWVTSPSQSRYVAQWLQATGDYMVVEPHNVAIVERLLAALRAPADEHRNGVVLWKLEHATEWETRGAVVTDRWYRGFGGTSNFTVLYYAPELARSDRPLIEAFLPPLGPARPKWKTYAPRHESLAPAAASALWHSIGRDLTTAGSSCAIDAMRGGSTDSDEYRWFGDHIAITATTAAHARLRQRLQCLADPDRLQAALPAITLRAADEPLLAALDRWSRAERRPIILLDSGGLKERLERKVTLDIQAQPLADFVREQLNDPGAADPIEVFDDDAALLIGPRSEFRDAATSLTRLFDLRAVRAKLPEMDSRQVVEWLLQATGHEHWKGSAVAEVFIPNSNSLTPVGDVLIARHQWDLLEQIEALLAFLASEQIDQLPRPALLFGDDAARVQRRYVDALATSNDETVRSYAAFWLSEGPALDAEQLAPLIGLLGKLDPQTNAGQLQAVCRVLAAHRGSAGEALEPLQKLCSRPAPQEVHTMLVATLASLGKPSIAPLAELLADSRGEDSRQLVRYLWHFGEASQPVVPQLLEWAFIEQESPDVGALNGVFSDHGGLLMRLDPDASRTREVLARWRDSRDSEDRQAYERADKFFKQWPAYVGDPAAPLWPFDEPPFTVPTTNPFWTQPQP